MAELDPYTLSAYGWARYGLTGDFGAKSPDDATLALLVPDKKREMLTGSPKAAMLASDDDNQSFAKALGLAVAADIIVKASGARFLGTTSVKVGPVSRTRKDIDPAAVSAALQAESDAALQQIAALRTPVSAISLFGTVGTSGRRRCGRFERF